MPDYYTNECGSTTPGISSSVGSYLAKSETLMVTRGKKGEVTHFALFLREFVSDCSSDSTAMKYEYSVKSASENEYTLVVDDVKADYAASLYSQYKCEEGFPGQYSSVKFMKCYENDVDVFESARREIGASVTMKVVFEKDSVTFGEHTIALSKSGGGVGDDSGLMIFGFFIWFCIGFTITALIITCVKKCQAQK